MTASPEFSSLLQSAKDLGIPHSRNVRYVSRNIVINHLRFHLLEWGDPKSPSLILLHGNNQSAHSWDLVSLHYAENFHVLALDRRGHGDSEWARDADYKVSSMRDDVLELIKYEKLEQPILLGHSMGGIITLAVALANPKILKAAVLVDAGPKASVEGALAIGNFITQNVEFNRIEDFIDKVVNYDPYRSRDHIERTARYNLLKRVDGAYISKSDRLLHDEGFRAKLSDSLPEFDNKDLNDLTTPILLIRGQHSNILDADAAESFVSRLSNGRLVTVPDCGHNVHSQNTMGFLQRVGPFLDSVSE